MKKIFVNKNGQTRSGWKIGLLFLLVFVLAMLFKELAKQNELWQFLAQETIIFGSTYIIFKIFERKRLKDIGLTPLKRSYQDLAFGLLIGMILMATVSVVLVCAGNVSISNSFFRPKFSTDLLTGLLLFISVGVTEEFLFRGYCMLVFKQISKTWAPVLLSSLVFSLAHGMNQNITFLALANTFLAGLFLAYMFIKTGNLWMPIGFHISWNYVQGYLIAFPVGGYQHEGIYNIANIKTNLITGGSYGPEGGVLVTVALIVGYILVWRYQRKNGNIQIETSRPQDK